MITLATATATSSAPSSAYFDRWVDHDTWAQWSPDTEWVRVDGPVALGAAGVIKPTGGPRTRFTISGLEKDREYTDTSFLPGARLVFQHLASAVDGATRLDVAVTMTGALAPIWSRIMGGGFAQSAQADLDRLVAAVEAEFATSK